MSWNSLFVVVRNTDMDALAGIGVKPVGPTLPAEVASTSAFAGVAAIQHGVDVVLINSDLALLTGGAILAQLLARETVTALFAGVSDSYLWRVDSPGYERSWMAQAGETLDQAGLATPEEYGVLELDEDTLWSLVERRTAFGGSGRWLEQEAQPVSWPPSGPAPKVKTKRRFFGREENP